MLLQAFGYALTGAASPSFTAVGSAERAGVFQGPAATATTPLAATDESRASPAVPADRSAACAAPAERQDAMPATAATVTPQRASRFAQLPAAEQMATYFQIADHFNARLAQLTSSPQDSEEYRSCVSNLIAMRKQAYDEMNALVASEIDASGVGTGTKDDPIALY